MKNHQLSLQKKYAPNSICFGCGPSNQQGLQIQSFVEGDQVVASFTPGDHHHAFPSVLCGGIIGAILDCHCNWAACYYLMQEHQLTEPPCTVTAEYSVKLKRPTPMKEALTLIAELVETNNNKVIVKGQIVFKDKIYDEFLGTFVMVKSDHPAYHRW